MKNMKTIRGVFIATLLMHSVFFIASDYAFSHSSDFQTEMLMIIWSCAAVITLIMLHKVARIQPSITIFEKAECVILYIIALIPFSLGGFFLFLALALHGADFK